MKPAFCLHKYCSQCNEEKDFSLEDECEFNYYYHCDDCENMIMIPKGGK
jgi:hypothetical protein